MQPQIPRRTSLCTGCSNPFEAGFRCFSIVVENEEESWERSDFCQVCWGNEAERAKEKNIPYWTATIPHKQAKIDKKNLSKKERAIALLKEALEKQDMISRQEAFVLALFLSHGRYIVYRKELHKEGETFQVYEDTAVNETYCVPLCDLSTVHIHAIQKAIAARMAE